jgi:hypothetical protein
LFVDEENVGCAKSNRGRTKTLTDSTRKPHKKEDSADFLNYVNSNKFTCNMLTSSSILSYL